MTVPLSQALDWGMLAPLRLRANAVAEGAYAGAHRSVRRGTGVEFGGHRNYVPGDDLRWLDRKAMMRHGRLLVRQFETETDRALRLVVDASASMSFRSARAPGAKLAYAAVLAAALARIALRGGDPVALDWIGGESCRPLPATGGKEAFARIVAALESVRPGGDYSLDLAGLERALAPVARHASRGAVIVLFSDFVDLPEGALEKFAALSSKDRLLIATRVLDPLEATFPLDGPVRLKSSEGNIVRETEAQVAKTGYLQALERIAVQWSERLVARGGRLVRASTTDDAVQVVRDIVAAVEGRPQ